MGLCIMARTTGNSPWLSFVSEKSGQAPKPKNGREPTRGGGPRRQKMSDDEESEDQPQVTRTFPLARGQLGAIRD